MAKRGKYMWADTSFDNWCKMQSDKMKDAGFNVSPKGVTTHLLERVIKPNNINLPELIKPRIRLNKKKWKRNII